MTRLAALLFGLSLLCVSTLAHAEGCTAIYRGATGNSVAQWDSFPCQPLAPEILYHPSFGYAYYSPYAPAVAAPSQWCVVPVAPSAASRSANVRK